MIFPKNIVVIENEERLLRMFQSIYLSLASPDNPGIGRFGRSGSAETSLSLL